MYVERKKYKDKLIYHHITIDKYNKKKSITKIQSNVRSFLAKKSYISIKHNRNRILNKYKNKCVILIQSL